MTEAARKTFLTVFLLFNPFMRLHREREEALARVGRGFGAMTNAD